RLPGLAPGAEPRVLDRDVTTIREVVGGAGENVHGEAGWLQEPPNVELGSRIFTDRRSALRGQAAGNAGSPTTFAAPCNTDCLHLANLLISGRDAPVQRNSPGLDDTAVDDRCRSRRVITQGEGELARGVALHAAQVVFAFFFFGALAPPPLDILDGRGDEGNDIRWDPVCGQEVSDCELLEKILIPEPDESELDCTSDDPVLGRRRAGELLVLSEEWLELAEPCLTYRSDCLRGRGEQPFDRCRLCGRAANEVLDASAKPFV